MLPNRKNKLLSGKDIISLKNNSLKDIPSGCKEYAPNNSWLEQKQIQVTLETHYSLVGSERIEKRASLSTAIWLTNVGKAKVTKRAGKIWEVFGHTVDSEDWLLPEEALFLLETNALELFREDVPLSIEETYTLVVGEHCSLEEYRVYSYLSRKGYRVLRHDNEITLTAYEKNIHLDQIDLAEKRSAPVTALSSKVVDVVTEEGGKAEIDNSTEPVTAGVPEVAVMDTGEVGSASPIVKELKCTEQPVVSCVAGAATVLEPDSAPVETSASPETLKKSAVRTENETSLESTDLPVTGVAKDEDSTGAPVEKLRSAEESGESLVCAQSPTGVKSPDSSVVSTVKEVVSTGANIEIVTSTGKSGESSVCAQSVVGVKSSDLSVPGVVKEVVPTGANVEKLTSSDESGESSVQSIKSGVVDVTVVDTDEKDVSSNSESCEPTTCDRHNLTVSETVSLKKRVGSSPDLYIVEKEDEEIIEIYDDAEDEESSTREVEMIEIEGDLRMDTVDLMDSDEDDDDVVFICQRYGSTDPSKWRQWFSTVPTFVNTTVAVQVDSLTEKPTKLKLIDLFDLGNKSMNTIMKAIPSHDGSACFINAPDLRFIPPGIVPKFAHYRINVQSYDSAVDNRDNYPVESHSTGDSNTHPNVDTSQSLSQVVQYGQEPANYSRNPYGYSFHRTRNYNHRRNPWNQYSRQNQQGQNHRPYRFNYDQNQDVHNPVTNEGPNQNHFNRYGGHDYQNRNYSSNAQESFNGPNDFRNPWNNNQNNFVNNQIPDAFGGQLKFALQQACQMQMLAMNLMQNSQALIQNFRAPAMFPNPPMNFNPMTNYNPMNNYNSLNNGNPPMNQFGGNSRGRRPYRRPYMRRSFGGRRRYFNDDRGSPKVTEITEVVCVDSDDEECKVKQKPAYKRMLALGAIANLNPHKRSKVISITDMDEKPEKPLKNEYQAPKANDSVKRERLSSRAESVGSSTCKTEPGSNSISLFSDVSTDDRVDSVQSPVSVTDESNDSVPMEIVDESSSSSDVVAVVDDVASTSEPKAPNEDVEEATEKRPDESSTANVEVTNESEPSALSGSWKSYKQNLVDHDELPNVPKTFSSLLNYDEQRAGVKDVLKSLQIFGPIDETESTKEPIKVSFDLYLPNQPFRKSVRLLPNYRVIVTGSTTFPSVYELNYLTETYRDDVPFLYAVVCNDSIGIYNLHSVSLPTLSDNM